MDAAFMILRQPTAGLMTASRIPWMSFLSAGTSVTSTPPSVDAVIDHKVIRANASAALERDHLVVFRDEIAAAQKANP